MFDFLFKGKKYLDCPFMKNSINFFYDEIRFCSVNVTGPVPYKHYDGSKLDWDYIFNFRQNIIKRIKSFLENNYIPDECKGCCELPNYITDKKPENLRNEIKKMYFHNHMSCNARCIYCTYMQNNYQYGYDVIEEVKEIIDQGILSKDARIYMSGGEITISKEFEDLLSLLLSHINGQIEILTSGIKYCKSIEDAFIQNKCQLIISIDSGSKETYKKIKQVDCFDNVTDNLKKYISASDNAKKNTILKYILVDDINDNEQEIDKFFELVKNLGILNVRLDFDYEKYKFTENISIPVRYFDLYKYFNQKASDNNLEIQKCYQIEAILEKNS